MTPAYLARPRLEFPVSARMPTRWWMVAVSLILTPGRPLAVQRSAAVIVSDHRRAQATVTRCLTDSAGRQVFRDQEPPSCPSCWVGIGRPTR